MKVAVILMLVVASAFADFEDNFNVDAESKAQIKKIEAECIKKHKVDPELVKKFDEGQFSDDHNLKCHHKCVFVSLDMMNDDGVFHTENLHGIVPKSEWEAADKCVQLRGSDACDTAYLSYKCYVEYLLKKKHH